MSDPVDLRDLFSGGVHPEPQECDDPEICVDFHNETGHHYDCECAACVYEYWCLKS